MKLGDKLSEIFRISPARVKALKKLNIETIKDLIYHFPSRYVSAASISRIADLKKGEKAVVFGRISKLETSKAFRKKIPMATAVLEDPTGKIKIVWFHQAYLAKMLPEGSSVRVEGRISERRGKIYISNPKIESAPSLFQQTDLHILYPVYPETRGLSSNWLYHTIRKILSRTDFLNTLKDPMPVEILQKYHLPDLKKSLLYIHTPKKIDYALAARKRFAFQEIFFIQLEKQKIRRGLMEKTSVKIEMNESRINEFIGRLPFQITDAQKRAIGHILTDLRKEHPMNRLLEGDVGSGKTAVAATAVYAAVTSRPKDQNFGSLQVAYMVPTEILAIQHFESFIQYFRHLPINIALITGSDCRKFPSKVNNKEWTNISRAQLLKWVSNGEISVVIGTHALIQKSIKFKHLALTIIDEQHRFGTAQRQKLVNRHGSETVPHLLSMTATPIPRTLALTIYGDLDLTLLDEMPKGRKKIITEIVPPEKRNEAYEQIKREMKKGRQLYVICPRIEESDPVKELATQIKSVKEEAKRLARDIFSEYKIGILHSKMKKDEKEKTMKEFKEKKIDILVATSVIEVGINVENASLIIIEGAERFGLAQLHQLRGRVLRSTHQPYCFVFSEIKSRKIMERLNALKSAKNGFELAELDLAQRGPGTLSGERQWGLSDIGMEAIKNIKMIEAARAEAIRMTEENPRFLESLLVPEEDSALLISRAQIHFE